MLDVVVAPPPGGVVASRSRLPRSELQAVARNTNSKAGDLWKLDGQDRSVMVDVAPRLDRREILAEQLRNDVNLRRRGEK
jgi:hypothetical protein